MTNVAHDEVPTPILSHLASKVIEALYVNGEPGLFYDPSDFERYTGPKGPELVTNGSFADASGWTLGNGWSIADGKATANTTNGAEVLSGTYPGKNGVFYEVTATVTMLATPHVNASVGINIGGMGQDLFAGVTQSALQSGVTYKLFGRGRLTSAQSFAVRVGSNQGLHYPLNYTIDNISIRELTAINTATQFQLSTGSPPVTALEQPGGLKLDRRFPRGAELVSNGTFGTDTTGWTGNAATGLSVIGGKLRVLNSTGRGIAYFSIETTPGKMYFASGGVLTGTVTGSFRVSTTSNGSDLGSVIGGGAIMFVATTTTTYVVLYNNSATLGQYCDYYDISVCERSGNHALQSTAAARPVLSARSNLLTYSEALDNAAWTKANMLVAGNTTTAPDGSLTADRLTATSTSGFIRQTYASAVVGTQYTISYDVRRVDNDWLGIYITGCGNSGVWFNTATGEFGSIQSENRAYSVINKGDGWYRVSVTGTATQTTIYPSIKIYEFNSSSGGAIASVDVCNAQFEVGAVPTRYQRVTTATDYDSTWFPHYDKYDGVDDGVVASSVSLTANMDFFVALRRDTAGNLVLAYNPLDTLKFFGVLQDATNSPGSITGVYYLNGAPIPIADTVIRRSDLFNAIPVGQWCVVEVRGLDLSAWGGFAMAGYPNYRLNGAIGGVVLCPAQDDFTRTRIRRYLATKVGVTL